MRRVLNVVLIIGAVCITVAVLYSLSNILQNLWAQSLVAATPVEAEDATNTFKEFALGFVFMAVPFLGLMWGLTVAVVRRQ